MNWDDPLYVTASPWIRLTLKTSNALFGSPFPAMSTCRLTRLSLSLNHAVSGFNPLSYHLTNVLLHLLNTTLIYTLVARLMQSPLQRQRERKSP